MIYRLAFTDDAKAEILVAKRWYESKQDGLSQRFEEAVVHTIGRILERPHLYPVCDFDARQAVVKDFPYVILYRISGDEVWILNVFHGHQQRGTQWRS